MNIDKVLNNPLINRNALARLMYPTHTDPASAGRYLYNKINNKQRQSLTFADREKRKKIIADLFADINQV